MPDYILLCPDCRPPLPVVLPASTGQGLQISAQLTRRDGQVFYNMLFENNSQVPLDGFMIQFNKNTFGLAAAGALQVNIAYIGFLLEYFDRNSVLLIDGLLLFRFHNCNLEHQLGHSFLWLCSRTCPKVRLAQFYRLP